MECHNSCIEQATPPSKFLFAMASLAVSFLTGKPTGAASKGSVSFLTAQAAASQDGAQGDKKAVAVQPHELPSAARVSPGRRLLGRVVGIEQTDTVFTCYLVCGPTRKQIIQIEAWRELATPAAGLLRAGELLSLTNVSLSMRKAEKMKFNYSGVQLFVRFDKKLKVESAADEAARPVSGFPELMLKDLSQEIPVTSFSGASCLREGLVRIIGRVFEAKNFTAKGAATEVGKASLEEVGPDGTRWQAELLGFGDHARQVATLEVNQTYVFFGLAVQAGDAKNGFAFKWVKGAGMQKTSLGNASSGAASAAGTVKMLSGSTSGSGFGAYASARACLVSASTLESILPVTGSRKFDNSIVWEVPWVRITDVSRRNYDEWHYDGCTECYKSNCTQHQCGTRRCYALDISFADHTSTLEAKLFTRAADDLFAAGGVAEAGTLAPDGQAQLLEILQGFHFSIRLAITEEEAYGNRPARNQLHVVRVRRLEESWTGTVKPLLRIPVSGGKCGVPAMSVQEISVDAADQVQGPDNVFLDSVELLVRIGEKKLQHRQQEHETGLRLIVEAFDHSDEECPAFLLMWIISIEALLDLARDLVADKVFCIIARPVVMGCAIQAWQVLQHSSGVNVTAWLARKAWQRTDLEKVAGRKRPALEAFAEKTPNSKVKVVAEALASPSYTAP